MKLLIENTLFFNKYAVVDDNNSLLFIDVVEKNNDVKLDDIFIGETVKVVNGLNAAFVNIGDNTGFLPLKNDKVVNGDKIIVQVIKEGNISKKPKLTQDITLRGKYIVLLPNEKTIKAPKAKKLEGENIIEKLKLDYPEIGMILRTKSLEAPYPDVRAEIDTLIQKYESFVSKKTHGEKLSQNDIENKVDQLIDKYDINDVLTNDQNYYIMNKKKFINMNLQIRYVQDYCFNHNGVNINSLIKQKFEFNDFSIQMDKTEAMTVIDVDSGYMDNSRLKESKFFEINKSAISKSIELITLLDIGGIILIDLINVSQDLREMLDDYVSGLVKKQKRHMKQSKITKNSLLEIICQKSSMSLTEKLTQKCHLCQGSGLLYSDEYLLDEFEITLKNKINNTDKKQYTVLVPAYRYDNIRLKLKQLENLHECIFYYEHSDDILHEIKIK
ncbi:ribonuclease E/G [Proteocatella sphenisci]|uniref:ribonuclease E/G n=1 Tax=Proteocatella sphenisci TaxID=181070 RepID=UPI00048DE280|nr:ribonuclease E/G [Proteocatella sphenisci]